MVQIIPSILATSEEQYQNDLDKLAGSEALKEGWIHIDFADSRFVPNQTVGVEIVEKYPAEFQKEAHLMVSDPRDWIEGLIRAGFKRIIIHVEANKVEDSIDYAKDQGLEVGLAIKNETDIEKMEEYIDKIDKVLVMTIIPGFQGQPFIPEALDKVKTIKAKNWQVKVGVDGHVSAENAKEIVGSGVDFIIVGSYLLKGNVDENLENLWEAING